MEEQKRVQTYLPKGIINCSYNHGYVMYPDSSVIEFRVALLPSRGGCSSDNRLTGSGRVGNDLSHNDIVEGRVVQTLSASSHLLDILIAKTTATGCAIEQRTATTMQDILRNPVLFCEVCN